MSEINLLRVAIIGTQKKFYALTTPFDLENVKNSYRKRQSKQRERNHIQTKVETYKQTLSRPCFQISQLLYATRIKKSRDMIKPWEVQTMRHGSFMIRTFNTKPNISWSVHWKWNSRSKNTKNPCVSDFLYLKEKNFDLHFFVIQQHAVDFSNSILGRFLRVEVNETISFRVAILSLSNLTREDVSKGTEGIVQGFIVNTFV